MDTNATSKSQQKKYLVTRLNFVMTCLLAMTFEQTRNTILKKFTKVSKQCIDKHLEIIFHDNVFLAKQGHDKTCNGCETFPIFGTMYKCKTCNWPDDSLCQKCKDDGKHSEHDGFIVVPEDPSIFLRNYLDFRKFE